VAAIPNKAAGKTRFAAWSAAAAEMASKKAAEAARRRRSGRKTGEELHEFMTILEQIGKGAVADGTMENEAFRLDEDVGRAAGVGPFKRTAVAGEEIGEIFRYRLRYGKRQ
jgi:hypothetical protein